jgi:hypothetical protein
LDNEFFKNKLRAIENRINSKIESQTEDDDAGKKEQSKRELNEFVTNLRIHFSEEVYELHTHEILSKVFTKHDLDSKITKMLIGSLSE